MVCTILTASALFLAPISEQPRMNTVEYFDSLIRVTERVLDRTICPEIERVQAVDKTNWETLTERQQEIRRVAAENRKERQREALERHCRASARVSKKDIRECDLN